MNKLVIMCITAIILSGCIHNERSEYTDIPPIGWIYGDTVYYHPEAYDSTNLVTGDLSIVIRHTNNYEYQNIWLELQYQNSDTLVTDTVNMQLADVYGKWLGNGIGVSYQRMTPVLEGVTLNAISPVRVSHIMRVDTLKDIEQVGIVFVHKE